MLLLRSTSEWARAVVDLPATGPLPCRTVLVFNERVAHALRRELLAAGRSDALAGTRFITPVAAASQVLHRAGVAFEIESIDLARTRVASVLRQGVRLEHFPLELLLGGSGWAEAFASTIHDLEDAGVRPGDLAGDAHPAQQRDVAAVWEATRRLAGDRWTPARVIAEGAAVVTREPSLWPFDGPVLATLAPSFSAVEARLALAIPGARLALVATRPIRATYVERAHRLLGPDRARSVVHSPRPSIPPAPTELDLLAAHLFETPDVLTHPARARSAGSDETVHLEEHAGIDSEIEAAADWVARQVLEHRTPLERIALLVPRLDPYAGLLATRLERLAVADTEPVAVLIQGGLPATNFAAGSRVLRVLRALRDHLPVEQVADLLSILRRSGDNLRTLSRGQAYRLAYALGTVGGHAADPRGALPWGSRAATRVTELEQAIARRRAHEGVVPQAEQHEVERLDRARAQLTTMLPPLSALCGVAAAILESAPLSDLWPAVRAFVAAHVLLPETGVPLSELLDAELAPQCVDPALGKTPGADALELILDSLESLRIRAGRFGEPAVYVGTIAGAVGIPFDAVRVLGLAEGHLPSVAREDAVLPDSLRLRLDVTTSPDRALAQLHALAAVVQNTRRAFVLSAPACDIDRSQREPSSVLLEAAAALGRPAPAGEPRTAIPGLRAVRRDGFLPARASGSRHRSEWPLTQASWHRRAASRRPPARWFGVPDQDLALIRDRLREGGVPAADGILGDAFELDLPGLTGDRPISASALRELLHCPHRFLFERVVGWREPEEATPKRDIDVISYGSLLHEVAEVFFREHGEAFCDRARSLEEWSAEIERAGERALLELLRSYPLLGDAARAQQLARLRGDLRRFLESEWSADPPRRFLAAEVTFGYGEPVSLDLGGARLFVRGAIDRLDVEGSRLMVRDLKTGRARPRRGDASEPTAKIDIQIGLYGLVARPQAASLGLALGAAYVYTAHQPERERAFREDYAKLETATLGWLRVAEGLLRHRAFARTPAPEDCDLCPFAPVCGDDFHPRVADALDRESREPLRALRVLKLGGP